MTTQTALARPRVVDWKVSLALMVFIINVVFYLWLYDPRIQGYVDAERGWRQFNNLLAGGGVYWGPDNQIELRIYMVMFTLFELIALQLLGFIDGKSLITYLALPVFAYLATKLKIEFMFFPLALISLNLSWRREFLVFAGIIILSILMSENNGYIILFFRALVRIFNRWHPPLYLFALMLIFPLIADSNMNILEKFVPELSAYSYTRDIQNTNYSVMETFIVFVASMTVGVNAYIDYPVGILGTAFVLWLAFGRQVLKRGSWRRWLRAPGFQAWMITILTFTALTHAFQDARYYAFYVPAFTAIGGERVNRILIFASVPMTFMLTIYYIVFVGM